MIMKKSHSDDQKGRRKKILHKVQKNTYLPIDIVGLILKRMNPKAAVSLSRVCKDWRNASKDRNPTLSRSLWLLMSGQKPSATWHLIKVSNSGITFKIKVRGIESSCCISSKDGWLVLMDKKMDRKIFLFNPFSRARMDLPLVRDISFTKVILSSSPKVPGCFVLALEKSGRIFLWRPGDQKWTIWKKEFLGHAICDRGRVVLFSSIYAKVTFVSIRPDNSIAKELQISCPRVDWPAGMMDCLLYLVESLRQILLVGLKYERDRASGNWNYNIMVFQLDLSKRVWIEVDRLDGRAAFLHKGGSFTVSAKETGCSANCIYFINPSLHDTAWHLYDMESRSVKICSRPSQLPIRTTNKVWITPSMT